MKADQKVNLRDQNGETGITGTIVGLGHLLELGSSQPFYIVKLDEAFYHPTQKLKVSVVVVHRQTLIPI
jgi:hypothetical protein